MYHSTVRVYVYNCVEIFYEKFTLFNEMKVYISNVSHKWSPFLQKSIVTRNIFIQITLITIMSQPFTLIDIWSIH